MGCWPGNRNEVRKPSPKDRARKSVDNGTSIGTNMDTVADSSQPEQHHGQEATLWPPGVSQVSSQDKRVTELPPLSSLDADDVLFCVDVSDTTDSPQGTSKRVLAGNLATSAGNVLVHGADPTGAVSSSQAFQDAVDSGHPVYAPPGKYYFDSQVTITGPLVITLARGGLTGWDYGDGSGPDYVATDEESCRIYTDADIYFFEVRSSNVIGSGGVFDYQGVNNVTKAPLYYPAAAVKESEDNPNGWSGEWLDFLVIGDHFYLRDGTNNLKGLYVDFENQTDFFQYWTHMKWRFRAYGCDIAFYANPRNDALAGGQFANNWDVEVDCDYCRQSVVSYPASGSRWKVRHQGRYVFTTSAEAAATPSMILDQGSQNIDEVKFFDFNDDDNGVYHKNEVSIEILRANVTLSNQHTNTYANAESIPSTRLPFRVENAVGYLPKIKASQFDRGIFISELHDEIGVSANTPGAVRVMDAYSGTEVADFSVLTDDSVTEGISTSSDITFTGGVDSIFLPWGAIAPSASWNSTAVTDQDYVEVNVELGYNLILDYVYVTVGNSGSVAPEQVQLIWRTNGGTVHENIIQDSANIGQGDPPVRVYKFDLTEATGNQLIVRFIGNHTASATMQIHEIVGARNYAANRPQVLFATGSQVIYGDLNMASGTQTLPLATTTELEDITDAVNTTTDKRQGAVRYNTTTNKPVYAIGSADGSLWVDATGATAHTPV